MNFRKLLMRCLLATICSVIVTGCVVVKHDPNYQPRSRVYDQNSVAYWYYYPQSRVYYHVTERYYYYPAGTAWKKTKRLPAGWVLDPSQRVRMKITGKPYLKHAVHQRRYPVRNMAGNKAVPPQHQREKARNHNANDDHPRREHHPGNQANRPEHAGRGNPENNHKSPGKERAVKGKFAKQRPGRTDTNTKRGKPEKATGQSHQGKGVAKQGPENGNPQLKKSHRSKHQPSEMVRGRQNPQPSHQQNLPASAQKKQTAKSNGKTPGSKGNGGSGKFKSVEIKQVNPRSETEARSNINVNKQMSADKQRVQKSPGKKQAKASSEKGKSKHGNSKGNDSNNQASDDTDDDLTNQPENTKGNKGNSKRHQ